MKPLREMSDDELKTAFEIAKHDLQKAADEDKDSEWHEICFAGTATIAFEIIHRGLLNGTVH